MAVVVVCFGCDRLLRTRIQQRLKNAWINNTAAQQRPEVAFHVLSQLADMVVPEVVGVGVWLCILVSAILIPCTLARAPRYAIVPVAALALVGLLPHVSGSAFRSGRPGVGCPRDCDDPADRRCAGNLLGALANLLSVGGPAHLTSLRVTG